MSRMAKNALLLGLSFGLMSLSSLAQSNDGNMYLVTDYMKVEPQAYGDYISLELDHWAKIHQARADNGKIIGWHLYQVVYPGGSKHDFNFVTVTLYDSFSKIDDDWSGMLDWPETLGMTLDELYGRTMNTREWVDSSLWVLNDMVPVEGLADYAEVNYMKVKEGNLANYLEMESEWWKPLHQAMKDQGTRAGWGLYELVLPRGSGLPYTCATVDFHHSFDTVAGGNLAAAILAAYPDADEGDMEDMTEETLKARSMVRTELWRLVGSVLPTPEEE